MLRHERYGLTSSVTVTGSAWSSSWVPYRDQDLPAGGIGTPLVHRDSPYSTCPSTSMGRTAGLYRNSEGNFEHYA